jgi:Ala-tRNA(Pro) deacylase
MSLNMMIQFLDAHEIEYTTTEAPSESVSPDPTFAPDRPGRILAETVMLKIDGGLAMAVIPSNHRLRPELLKELIDAESLDLADTQELCELFPDCDADAIPPFGTLQGMRVVAAEALSRSPRLAFYAGLRTQVVEMLYSDYVRLLRPIVAPISMPPVPHTRGRPGHVERHEATAHDEATRPEVSVPLGSSAG